MTATLPTVTGMVAPDGTATVTAPDGTVTTVNGTGHESLEDLRRHLVSTVADLARTQGHERVHARLTDPEAGTADVVVTAAGAVEALPATTTPAASAPPASPDIARRRAGHRRAATPDEPSNQPDPAPKHQAAVASFLVTEEAPDPATTGWRGAANRLGLRLAPSDAEMGLRRAVRTISQHWPGVRKIAVTNPKGSASKTPTTISLSAAFAVHGGGGVAAVDNNPTRGTLGWRTEQGPHQASVTDLIPHIEHLLRAEASGSELPAFLHHQTEDRYDVLRSKPEKLGPPFTADEFDQVVSVLTKYYRILVFDSGNDETAPVWQRMIDTSTQLVVPTLARREWAEAGRLLLEELAQRDQHGAELVNNAVVIVSQADERRGIEGAQSIADGFRGLVRATAVIPYDPHMVEGHLRWSRMARTTREAWTRAAALVAQGF